MKVSDAKIDSLINAIEANYFTDAMAGKRLVVRAWLSEVEAEQNRRIADELMSVPAFLKEQNQ